MKPQGTPTEGGKNITTSEKFKNREGQIELAKKIGPVICAIFEKISGAFDTHSRLDLPNGRALTYVLHNNHSVVYRCGAFMKISIPFDFIETLDEGTVENIDQMIRNWTFSFNGIDIPPELWCDNPHYDVNKPVTEVPKKIQKALETTKPTTTKGQRLVNKLLPPRIASKEMTDSSERGVPKLRQTELKKFPLLFIEKR